MDFVVTIETGNSAFEDESPTREIARILRELADDLDSRQDERWFDGKKLLDVNGNTVGRVTVA